VSDLVLDVVQAADPSGIQAAREKLKVNGAAAEATLLASNGNGFAAAVHQTSSTASSAAQVPHAKVPETYRKLEASIASTFIQSMMPAESEEIYGKGSAGEFWKSMMSEKIADAVSKRGGFGIAEELFSQSVQKAKGAVSPTAATDQNDRNMAVSMITDFQRRTLSTTATDDGAA
jgi:Rod binding domain-containing protein